MTDLTALLEAQTDRYVQGDRGRFVLSDEYIVIPDDQLWQWLDDIGALYFHLVARSDRTGAFHNMPSVQKRVRNSKYSGKVRNVGHAMSQRHRNTFGTYVGHRVNERRNDGFRTWHCRNVVAIRITLKDKNTDETLAVDYIPESVDRWLNGGIFPW